VKLKATPTITKMRIITAMMDIIDGETGGATTVGVVVGE